MAFNNFGPQTWIAPGQTMYWWFDYGGADRGAQYGSPDVKTRDGHIKVFEQSKQIGSGGWVTYHCGFQNVGSMWALHNLQGGGFV